jgi:Gpi18-like mannosyltransferase
MKRVVSFISNYNNLLLLLGIALLFRLVLIPSPGFEADISFWKSWGLAVRDYGIVKGLPLTNFNYPTPFAYVLALMSIVYSLFKDPHNFNEFWNNSNLLFLAIAKSLPIAADFGIFAVFVWLGKNAKRIGFPLLPPVVYTLFGLIYLFNPLSFFDGALWGQVDSVGVFLFLIANCLVFTKKPFLAGVVYMVAMMTKLQNMIYGPVFFLFIWQYLGFDGCMQAIGGSVLTFVGLNVEHIQARSMARVAGDLTGNYDYFPWMSLNAYNVWWIASGAQGMKISDKIMAIGITNAKTVGLYLFSSTYLLSMLTMLKGKLTDARDLTFRYLSGLIIAASAFFLFQTESHDRYAFPICVFLLVWAPFFFSIVDGKNLADIIKTKIFKYFLLSYATFCVIFFYNIHNALLQNYPNNGIPLLSGLNIPILTITASFTQIGLFFAFLFVLRRHITPVLFAVWIGVFVVLLTVSNSALILKKPVYITKLTPVTSTAGYGQRMVNMPVDAYFGFPKWGFLSVQYAFYRHGLGTHAPSREVFDINKQFRTLSTDMGIDTDAGAQGSVQFVVYGDGKLLFSSPIKKRYDFPSHADIDVTGVKTLELIINDAGNGNFDDHADWLNTQLIP